MMVHRNEEFSPEELAELIITLAHSRTEPFVYSHSNQDANVFVLVFQTTPRKYISFPFHNAEQRKSIVASIVDSHKNKAFLEEKGMENISTMADVKNWAENATRVDKYKRFVVNVGPSEEAQALVFVSLLFSSIKRYSYTGKTEDTRKDIIVQQIHSQVSQQGHGTTFILQLCDIARDLERGVHLQQTNSDEGKAFGESLIRDHGFYKNESNINFFN